MNINVLRILAVLLLLTGSMPVQAEVPAPAPASSSTPPPAPAPPSALSGGDIEFVDLDKGGPGEKLSLAALKAIAPPVSLEIFEPQEVRECTYRALPAQAVFDAIFGTKWKKAKEMVFLSTDGYRAVVPVVKFIEYEGYLAFEHDDGSPFRMINNLQHDELTQLGPLYLVWDNLNSRHCSNPVHPTCPTRSGLWSLNHPLISQGWFRQPARLLRLSRGLRIFANTAPHATPSTATVGPRGQRSITPSA